MFGTLNNTLQFLPLKTGRAVGDKLLNEGAAMMGDASYFLKGIVDKIIVPGILAILLIYVLFQLGSIGWAKKQNREDTILEKIPHLIGAVVIFVIVFSYGLAFGNLMSFILS